MTLKSVLRAIGTTLAIPTCLLVFLIGWPLYVLFDVSVVGYDGDDD